MSRFPIVRNAAFFLAATVAGHANADSFASSASSAGSASSGSSSESLHGSSDSSRRDHRAENVDYKIVAIDDAVDRPGHARLTLQADGGGERLLLDVPQAIAKREAFVAGDVITARQRVYGWAFAHGGAPDPFFLVVTDHWQAGFAARRVL